MFGHFKEDTAKKRRIEISYFPCSLLLTSDCVQKTLAEQTCGRVVSGSRALARHLQLLTGPAAGHSSNIHHHSLPSVKTERVK